MGTRREERAAAATAAAPAAPVRVGEAAARVGVAAHVLRHWEDEGLLRPRRAASGERRYSELDLEVAHLILLGRSLGLPLARMRDFLDGDADRRRAVLTDHADDVRRRLDELGTVATRLTVEIERFDGDCPYAGARRADGR